MTEDALKIPPPVNAASGDIGVHLSYIRRDVDEIKHVQMQNMTEIKERLKEIQDGHVTRSEFNDFMKAVAQAQADNDKVLADHETRIRATETSVAKVMTWGTALLVFLSIVQFLVSKFL